jgi:hypothetical protein
MTRMGLKREFSTHGADPLTHAADPKPSALLQSPWIESNPVVADTKNDGVPALFEQDFRLPRMSVFDDVVESFLCNAV